MAQETLGIKPYFGGLYNPPARSFILVMALMLTAIAILADRTVISNFWLRCLLYFFALMVDTIAFFASFTYTDFDEHRIAKVFRLGRFIRFDYLSVSWDDVLTAKSKTSPRNTLVYLQITKKNGRKLTFAVPPKSDGASSFEEIARHFQKSNLIEYA